MWPLAVDTHYKNDSRKSYPPHDQSAPAEVETTTKIAAVPTAAIAAAHAVFAELDPQPERCAAGAETAELVARISGEPELAVDVTPDYRSHLELE